MDESLVLVMLGDHLNEKAFQKTISLGSFNEYILHGALETTFQTSVWNLDKVMKAMYWLLHESPARCEIYVSKGGSSTFPLRWILPGDIGEIYASF